MEPATNRTKVVRLGAISLIVSAALLLIWNGLSALSGHPPGSVDQIAPWIGANSLTIALSDESLSFATFFLVPGCLGLATRLWTAGDRVVPTVLGCSCLALSVVTLSLMNIALGRLVYPVFGIVVGNEALALSASAFYGAFHQTDLLWAVASGFLGFSLYRSGESRWLLVFSLVVAAAELAAAYPWLFSAETTFLLRLPFAAWLLLVGTRMLNPLPVEAKT